MMAEEFIRDYPGLRPFVLSDVQLTGRRIGGGAYGRVEEVAVPVRAAEKTIYAFLQEGDGTAAELPKAAAEFVKECQLMSILRHPNIVQFLGVAFFPWSRLPAFVMERLLTSLHDLLDPGSTPPSRDVAAPLSFFSIALKVSVLHDVACGLAYLHERSPPVIHRDLSARNVLLDSDVVVVKTDLGVARIVPRARAAATMTKGPGALVYMPPEAFAEKSKYDASIDVFSFGVVTIFTIGETFPCDPLEPTYLSEETGLLVARTELQRRCNYMRYVNEQLRKCGQLRGDHPLIRLIQQCLHNSSHKRPNIRQVVGLLEKALAGVVDGERERNKRGLVQALQTQPRNHNFDRVMQDLVRENTDLLSLVQDLQSRNQKIEQDLQSHMLANARVLTEKEEHWQQQLEERDVELVKAEEVIRRDQQQIEELRRSASYTCQVSGPGLTSATVNQPTHVLIELIDPSGRPHPLQLKITGQLEPVQKATRSKTSFPWSKKQEATPHNETNLPIAKIHHSQYKVQYTAISRGQHTLHIQVNDREINGSPFIVTVYPDPCQLGHPVRMVTDLDGPHGIAYNNHQEMVVSENFGGKVSILNKKRQKIKTFSVEMVFPTGVATDDAGNVYVGGFHKLKKFTRSGNLITSVGQFGRKEGEFDFPRGVTLYSNQVYVCDRDNHRIQVFDCDLNFIRSIGSRGRGEGEFKKPLDVKFDTARNMYVADSGNHRVQVIDTSGQFIRSFGQEGEGKLSLPSGLFIADNYVYVSDANSHCITVYDTSGLFVTSFGKQGSSGGEFYSPCHITSCAEGFIHVCDWNNRRVQMF